MGGQAAREVGTLRVLKPAGTHIDGQTLAEWTPEREPINGA
mgnify:CR=1 FL=1